MKAQILFGVFLFLGMSASLAQFQQPYQQQQQQQRLQQPPPTAPQDATPPDRSKNFLDHIASKTNMTKGQKDSLTTIFLQFIDDVKKYRAENNQQVINYMQKIRDDKVKVLLHDDAKFEKYLLMMEEMKKQRQQQPRPQEQSPQTSPVNPTGGNP